METTIAAIATPSGEGAIGVIRLSGPQAVAIVRQLASLPAAVESHRALLRTLRREGDVLDQALVLPFLAPASFTGEDVVELHCHGGRVTLGRVLDACLAAGAVPAEPGEFSRRAMLNGKLDLVQVEAIADIIHAESEAAHRLAQSHLAGRLSQAIDDAKESLAELVTLVEAAIDFSLEEHVYSISASSIVERLARPLGVIRALLATYDAGRMQADGVRVAIVGRPNAGKSTLLNHLLGEERAIVTDVAGTTRDTIEESITLNGVRYVLVDTAGVRDTSDTVEAIGVDRARSAARSADVLVWVEDAATERGSLEELLGGTPPQPVVHVRNKVDLAPHTVDAPAPPSPFRLDMSLKTGAGVDGIESALQGAAEAAGLAPRSESVLLSRARHRSLLEQALEALERAEGAAASELGHELVALDLRGGLDALGELTGAVTSDAVLNRIFGDFCIGK